VESNLIEMLGFALHVEKPLFKGILGAVTVNPHLSQREKVSNFKAFC
jgi:hypothetical protein